jgi:very-short-patch-repair endonuclease
MSTPSSSINTYLAKWRDKLIDLTRRNPLLYLRPTRSSFLTISHPPLTEVFDRLVQAGKSWSFWVPPVDEEVEEEEGAGTRSFDLQEFQPKANELVCADHGRRSLQRILTNLYRRSHADYQDRGLRILHVVCGVLEWRETERDETVRSPLVLIPVQLSRASVSMPFVLSPVEEEPFLNPALQARLLQDFKLRLPAAPEDWEEKSLASYLDEIKTVIAHLPGWRIDSTALLTLFSFFKGVMHQDLEDHAERVAAHPLVRALAHETVGEALAGTPLPDEEELDNVQPPEKTFHILDADSSQRLCLQAVAQGHSFVLQGPPGTGKSQTITNLIAECLAGGKKVLFVSEKMAALEVVYNRLRNAGLGDFCLELHSHKANKREVVAELRRSLEERQQPSATLAADESEKLRQRREQLNAYVKALHTVREPLQQSVWWALGELSERNAIPSVSLALPPTSEMSLTWLEDSKQAVQRMQNLWHVHELGANFPWWGFKAERFNLKLRDEVTGLVERVQTRLDKMRLAAEQYGAQLGLPMEECRKQIAEHAAFGNLLAALGSIPWLLRLGELLEASPAPPASWLTATDLPQLAEDLELCAEAYQRRGQTREPLTARYGPGIWKLPEGTAAGVEQAWHAAAPLLAPGDERGAGLLTHQQQLRGWAADTQKRIPGWLNEVRILEKWLAIPLPLGAGHEALRPGEKREGKLDPSPLSLRRLLRLANLCQADTTPERSWLVDPNALQQAQALIESSRPVFSAYQERRTDLLKRYTEQFFELDLETLAQRFTGPYRSWTRFFSLQYRRDRRAIGRRSRGELMPSTIWDDIVVTRDLMQEKARLEKEQPQRKAILGRHEKGFATDLDAVQRATQVAQETISLVHELESEEVPAKLADAMSAGTAPPEKVRAAAKRLHDSFGAWLHTTEELSPFLPMESLPETGQPLEESALTALMQYARNLQASLNHFAMLTDPALAQSINAPADAVALVADLKQAEQLRSWEADQESEKQRWTARFGPGFQGVATDWNALRKSFSWTVRLRELFAPSVGAKPAKPLTTATGKAARAAVPDAIGVPPAKVVQLASAGTAGVPSSRELRHAQEQVEHALHSLEIRFEAPAPQWEGKKLRELPLDALKQRLQTLRERGGDLADWIDWRLLSERFAHLGLTAFEEGLKERRPPREQLVDIFVKAALLSWVESIYQQEPALRDFRRDDQERAIEEFRELDRKLIRLAAQRVTQLADGRRPQAPQALPGSEIATLMREAHKKSKHLPLRRLFEEIPNLLLQLKPCLLMSPLSVSQFLHPEKIQFDLVVFDEASQICPEDAIGAIYRGKQVVVTGDDKQLPPTTFFQAAESEEEEDEDAETPAVFESILDACLGAGLSQRMLRWHYRSRHESLIAYSNQRFYDNKLVTFPAARAEHPLLGVKFQHVADGVYDRGGRRDNQREAEVIADLVFAHYRDQPGKSVGVIAFSQAQMTAIEDAIEQRLRDHPELEASFKEDRLEGFFVKNLETVQGDERDVILLSVGYGPDAQGRLTMNFGPLNKEGGQRRLNVAVTRAREKLVVVSSIRAGDLDLKASQAPGVLHLHQYLDYAQRGVDALELTHPQGQAEADSPLEAEVMKEVRALSYQVVPQVGCSGFRIDLGVLDPAAPGNFLLGIECDGATYHSAATARDRDRLRQEVLEGLGWRIHRIWAPDWFSRRTSEVERLQKVLDSARKTPVVKPTPTPAVTQAPAATVRKVEVRGPNQQGGQVHGTVPYRVCNLHVPKKIAKMDLHSRGAQTELCRLLAELVRVEGPIHVELATRRLRQAWKLDRAGDRVREAVEKAIVDGETRKQLQRRGDFLWPVKDSPIVVRVPDPKNAATNREIEHIPAEELQAAMRLLVKEGGAMNEDALLSQTARLFGFGKLGDTIREKLRANLEILQQQGVCDMKSGAVTLTC